MSWMSEAPPHEGWVANIVADGRVSASSNALGVFVTTAGGDEEHLPWDQVVVWRMTCECGWTGPSVPAFTDPEYGFRDCPDEIADSTMLPAWTAHVAPFEAVLELGTVCAEIDRLSRRAEDLVASARSAGVSWSQLGSAAGLTRQGAQQRWGHLVENSR